VPIAQGGARKRFLLCRWLSHRSLRKLSGLPTFDGGACASVWAAGDLNNEKFMIYVSRISAHHVGSDQSDVMVFARSKCIEWAARFTGALGPSTSH
jgi:hypothetical protein